MTLVSSLEGRSSWRWPKAEADLPPRGLYVYTTFFRARTWTCIEARERARTGASKPSVRGSARARTLPLAVRAETRPSAPRALRVAAAAPASAGSAVSSGEPGVCSRSHRATRLRSRRFGLESWVRVVARTLRRFANRGRLAARRAGAQDGDPQARTHRYGAFHGCGACSAGGAHGSSRPRRARRGGGGIFP